MRLRWNDTCVVAASGPDLPAEYEAAHLLIAGKPLDWGQPFPAELPYDVMAVNFTGLYLPRVTHLVSHHQPLPDMIRQARTELDWAVKCQGIRQPQTHAPRPWAGVDHVHPGWAKTGTSSMLAARVAVKLGYTRVILCGVPLSGAPRFYDPWWWRGHWDHTTQYDREPWAVAAQGEFAGKVVSMGAGYTRDVLGGP